MMSSTGNLHYRHKNMQSTVPIIKLSPQNFNIDAIFLKSKSNIDNDKNGTNTK